MRQALSDPALFGNVLAGDSWKPWRVVLIAAMGEALTVDERAIFKDLTGREREPLVRVEELVAVVGRRGGKSRAMSVLAAYISALCEHDLVAGERGICLCIAPDARQARLALNYAGAVFEQSPILSQLKRREDNETIELTNGISIEVRSSSFRRLRGPTYVAVLADEAAFWLSDDSGSANPDTEILNAVRPGLATTRGPLIIASSPYARRGELWNAYRRHYGANGDPLILVAQGASNVLNPSLPQSVIDRAYERDPASAAAEYGAQFRTDIEAFIKREVVEAVVSSGVYERAPLRRVSYVAFVDPSGGSADSFTLAVAHREDKKAILDALREAKPPFSPEHIVADFAALLKTYRIAKVQGDRYAGEWPREQFRKHGIGYEPSAKPKSDLYRDLLPALNSGGVDLLDHPRLVNQLVSLERRTARSGKDSIDHPPKGHDDVANAVAGALVSITTKKRYGMLDVLRADPNERPSAMQRAFWNGGLPGFRFPH